MYRQSEIDQYQITQVKGDQRTVAWAEEGTEEKALVWFMGLDAKAQLAQIRFRYEDYQMDSRRRVQAMADGRAN